MPVHYGGDVRCVLVLAVGAAVQPCCQLQRGIACNGRDSDNAGIGKREWEGGLEDLSEAPHAHRHPAGGWSNCAWWVLHRAEWHEVGGHPRDLISDAGSTSRGKFAGQFVVRCPVYDCQSEVDVCCGAEWKIVTQRALHDVPANCADEHDLSGAQSR